MAEFQRRLGVLGAVAISLAVMGPSLSVSLNPQAIAEEVGAAVPTTFLIAVIPISIFVGSFVILTKRRGSAGSAYGLVGAEIGPRTGTAAGICLVGSYIAGTAITASGFGIFTGTVVRAFGVTGLPGWTELVLAFVMVPVTTVIAGRAMEGLGKLLLIMEGLTMTVIVVVAVLVLARLLGRGGPEGQRVDFGEFAFTNFSTGALALALSFAVLSSAGFEGAAAAGEETRNPLRAIPRALILTTVITCTFYIAISAVAVWAFGTGPSQLKKFAASGSLPADLADAYVADGVGDFITIGGAMSAFACMIGAQVAGGRVLYAFARDGVLPSRLARLSDQGTPALASRFIALGAVTLLVFAVIVTRGTAFSVFELTSDVTAVAVLGAYGSVCAAASVVLWRRGRQRTLALIPMIGVVIGITILLLQLIPIPSGWKLAGPSIGLLVLVMAVAFGRRRGHLAEEAFSARAG